MTKLSAKTHGTDYSVELNRKGAEGGGAGREMIDSNTFCIHHQFATGFKVSSK